MIWITTILCQRRPKAVYGAMVMSLAHAWTVAWAGHELRCEAYGERSMPTLVGNRLFTYGFRIAMKANA